MMSDLEPMDHLVLLVGTNPVPNYVVGRYILKQAGGRPPKLWYVYTKETDDVLTRLEEHVGGGEALLLANPYEPEAVYAALQTAVSRRDGIFSDLRQGHVHLNYTGGTKVMSVEAVTAALEALKGRLIRSYLSPRDYRLHLHRVGDNCFPPFGEPDLRAHVKPNVEKLLTLHGCARQRSERAAWPQVAQVLLDYVRLNYRNYQGWADGLLPTGPTRSESEFRDMCETWKNSLTHPINKWPPGSQFSPVLHELKLVASRMVEEPPCVWNRGEAVQFVRFFCGGWLEECVFTAADAVYPGEVRPQMGVRVVHCSPQVERSERLKKRDMELDVVVLQGYALTLFSCTWSRSTKTIKLKAFEALHRARQLGGEEALAVVVSLATTKNLEELYEDLATDDGARPRLRFVGDEGLQSLTTLTSSIQGIATGEQEGNKERVVF
jgi:hypothetical protein